MNRFDYAKECVYNALRELCEYDDDVYQNACSGLCKEEIMESVIDLAVKLSCLSQEHERKTGMSKWEAMLKTMPIDEIAFKIQWAFSDEDLASLMELHKSGSYRSKIEDLLTECNFHTACAALHDGNYNIWLKEEHT